MKKGTLSNMDEAYWIPDDKRQPSLKELLSWEGIKKFCSDFSGSIEIPDPEEGWFDIIDEVPTYHCPNCQIFLFAGREGKEIL